MANNQTPFNLTNLDPKQADFLNDLKRDIFLKMKCHDIGTIKEVNLAAQTVSVSINYKKTVVELQKDGSYGQATKEYPLLLDCPFVNLRGGAAGLSLPIAVGDTCIVMYNDRSIDDWFSSGAITQVSSTRLHSMSDGIALVGVNSMKNLVEGYDPNRAVLYNGQSKVAVGEKIHIANSEQNLKDLLTELIAKVKALADATAQITVLGVTSGGATSGLPSNAATISSISNELSAISSDLGGLLE